MNVIDKVASMKERRVRRNSQEWFQGEIVDEIKNHDRLLKEFKKSKLKIDEDMYNMVRCKLQKIIVNKKEHFLKTN